MSTLFPRTINLLQRSGSYVGGKWVDTTTPATFVGSVQPVTGKELQTLPVARHDIGSVKIYSSTALQVSKEGQANTGDLVIWAGRKWEIVAELANQNDLIPHFKYIGQERGAA